jgi:beta-mannanase
VVVADAVRRKLWLLAPLHKKVISMRWFVFTVGLIAASSFVGSRLEGQGGGGVGASASLSTIDASQVTNNVYKYLATRENKTNNKMLEGQHLGGIRDLGTEFQIEENAIFVNSERYLPAMVGTRYDTNDEDRNYTLTADYCTKLNAELIRCWNAFGTVIHINAVSPNPWNNESERSVFSTSNSISELFADQTNANANTFWSNMGIIGDALKELEREGIPVMYRPFPEFNSGNKYYFTKDQNAKTTQNPAHFRRLWREVHQFMTRSDGLRGGKNLKNLIFCWEPWVFNRAVWLQNADPWYPGPTLSRPNDTNYLDIVAGAFYFKKGTNYFDSQNRLVLDSDDRPIYDYLLGRNRPFGGAQFGLDHGDEPDSDGDYGDHTTTLRFINSDNCPRLAFAYFWDEDFDVQLPANTATLVTDARIATDKDLTGTTSNELHRSLQVKANVVANNGWIQAGSQTGTDELRTGDTASNQVLKSIVSFNLSGLPSNAQVVSARLRLKRKSHVNNPYDFGGKLKVDVDNTNGFGTSFALQSADFTGQDAQDVSTAGVAKPVPGDDWTVGYINAAGLSKIKQGTVQFRLYFTGITGQAGIENLMRWYGATASDDNQPVLLLRYHVP